MRLLRYRRSAAGSIVRGLAHDVPVVERIAALGAEFRQLSARLRLPSAFIAAVLRNARRLGRAALAAELPFVKRSARARPAIALDRLGLTAFGAELPFVLRTAAANPAITRLRLRRAAALAESAAVFRLTARAGPSCGRNVCRSTRSIA